MGGETLCPTKIVLSELLKSLERARKDRSGKLFIKVKRIWLLEIV